MRRVKMKIYLTPGCWKSATSADRRAVPTPLVAQGAMGQTPALASTLNAGGTETRCSRVAVLQFLYRQGRPTG